jgi:hypothetical protein
MVSTSEEKNRSLAMSLYWISHPFRLNFDETELEIWKISFEHLVRLLRSCRSYERSTHIVCFEVL